MSAWQTLSRVLLAIGLVLSASGYALALEPMPVDHPAHASTISTSLARLGVMTQASCVEHHSNMGSASSKGQGAQDSVDASSVKSEDESRDCCRSGACRCACVHQCQAAVFLMPLQLAPRGNASHLRPMESGHDSPAVPHLIRPPIA